MKKRSREINIFSVSALDLFASALGAFILMSLIFMVFFTMTSQDAGEAAEVQAALEQCEGELASAEARAADLGAQLDESQAHSAELEARLLQTVDSAAMAACRSQLAESESALVECRSQLETSSGVTDRLERAEEELEACERALRRSFVLVIASWSTYHDVDLHVVDPAGREFFYRNRRISGSSAALEEDNTRGPGNEVWLHPSAETGRYRVCYKLFSGSPSTSVRGSILWQEGKIEVPNINLTQEDQVRLAVDVLVDDDGRVSVDRSRSGTVLGTRGCA